MPASASNDSRRAALSRRCAACGPCLVAVLLLAACGAPGHPTEYGARVLPGTERLEGRSTELFSLSPTGELLLVTLAAPPSEPGVEPSARGEAGELVAMLARTILYAPASGAVRRTRADAQALRALAGRRPELFLPPACWSAAGDSVYLGGSRGAALALALGDVEPEWRLVQRAADAPAGACPASRPRGEQLLGTHGAFIVERAGGGVIRVRSATDRGRVLLEFRARLLQPDASVHDVATAPAGQRLAIVLSRGQGAFSGTPELFVASLVDGEPPARSLGGPAYGVRWTPDGAAILGASRLPGSAELAIYRWES